MLLKFRVENYRSIKDAVEVSMEATKYYKEQPNQLIDEEIPGLKGKRYLRIAAIYGHNGSGKSSIYQAIRDMRSIFLNQENRTPEDSLDYHPFAFSPECKKQPTDFSIAFFEDSIRYEYAYSYTENVIWREELVAYPKGRKQFWFSRETLLDEEGEYRINVRDSAAFRIPNTVKPLLNKNVLLLSLLSNYPNFEASKKSLKIKEWFEDRLQLVSQGPRTDDDYPYTGEILDGKRGTETQRSIILNIMKNADVGISDSYVEHKHFSLEESAPETVELLQALQETLEKFQHGAHEEFPLNAVVKAVRFRHKDTDGSADFRLSDESDGTYQLFVLSGYIAEALERGSTLVVDEIDASLHPVLVQRIIETFTSHQSNPNNAQLIFIAHNPCLLRGDTLRRDQVWFTRTNSDGATELSSLAEYKPRNDKSVFDEYLQGKYVPNPNIPQGFNITLEASGTPCPQAE